MTDPESTRPLRRRVAALLLAGAATAAAMGCSAHEPPPAPPAPSAVSATFPPMTGLEFDRSLRNGEGRGESALPPLGRLLAATENGGPTTIPLDPAALEGKIVGVFVCHGAGPGPEVSVTRGTTSLLWFKSDGCDPENIYSGESPPVSRGGPAILRVSAPAGTTYAVVLEQVREGGSRN